MILALALYAAACHRTTAKPHAAFFSDAHRTIDAGLAESQDAHRPWNPPANTVSVNDGMGGRFYVDRTEVTVAAYRQCVAVHVCMAPVTSEERPPDVLSSSANEGADTRCLITNMTWDLADHDAHPINCVSAAEAQAYCVFRGGRLPSQHEWELAARGGRDYIGGVADYPWGNDDPTCRLAVMRSRKGPGCGTGGTLPVGSRPAGTSPTGALDMAGNVAEIVAHYFKTDLVSGYFYPAEGGSYADDDPYDLAIGATLSPKPPAPQVGFRCIYDPSHPTPRY